MMTAGFIHFDCLCGLDIYFFGDLPSGEPPLEAIDTFRSRLPNHHQAIFTSNDDTVVSCPCCDSLIQLPTAKVAAFLGQMTLDTTKSGVDNVTALEKTDHYPTSKHSDGYNLQLTRLN